MGQGRYSPPTKSNRRRMRGNTYISLYFVIHCIFGSTLDTGCSRIPSRGIHRSSGYCFLIAGGELSAPPFALPVSLCECAGVPLASYGSAVFEKLTPSPCCCNRHVTQHPIFQSRFCWLVIALVKGAYLEARSCRVLFITSEEVQLSSLCCTRGELVDSGPGSGEAEALWYHGGSSLAGPSRRQAFQHGQIGEESGQDLLFCMFILTLTYPLEIGLDWGQICGKIYIHSVLISSQIDTLNNDQT